MDKQKLEHRIERLTAVKDKLEAKYNGKETTVYNFYGGWDLGYVRGQLSVLENLLDDLEEAEDGII